MEKNHIINPKKCPHCGESVYRKMGNSCRCTSCGENFRFIYKSNHFLSVNHKSITITKKFRDDFTLNKDFGLSLFRANGELYLSFLKEKANIYPNANPKLAYTIYSKELSDIIGTGKYMLIKIPERHLFFKIEKQQ